VDYVGKGREHDCMDAGGRATQEQLPRSGSFSGKYHPNSPETPPRATRLDGLIPAYIRARHSSVHVEMTLLDRLVYNDESSGLGTQKAKLQLRAKTQNMPA